MADVASKMHVSENTVRRWESGLIKTIPYEQVHGLAELFEVTPAFVLGWPEKINGDGRHLEAAE